ncbi:MAG: DUF2953 domain-containing protein [Clostridia bacterium]|nr:DUF2953 domain-containing protein [Clostridia bacterium]
MEIFLTVLAVLGITVAALLLIAVIIILFCYCKLHFSYSEEKGVYLAVETAKIRITLLPKKEKKKKREKKKNEKKESKLSSLVPKDNKSRLLLIFELLKCISLKFKLFKFDFYLLYGTGDAAKTAIDIGKMHAFFGSFFGAAQNIIYVNKPEIVLTPEYLEKTVKIQTEIILGLKITSALGTLIRWYRAAVKFSKKESETK